MIRLLKEIVVWFALHKARRERDRNYQIAYDHTNHNTRQGQRSYERLAARIDEQYEKQRQEVRKQYGLS